MRGPEPKVVSEKEKDKRLFVFHSPSRTASSPNPFKRENGGWLQSMVFLNEWVEMEKHQSTRSSLDCYRKLDCLAHLTWKQDMQISSSDQEIAVLWLKANLLTLEPTQPTRIIAFGHDAGELVKRAIGATATPSSASRGPWQRAEGRGKYEGYAVWVVPHPGCCRFRQRQKGFQRWVRDMWAWAFKKSPGTAPEPEEEEWHLEDKRRGVDTHISEVDISPSKKAHKRNYCCGGLSRKSEMTVANALALGIPQCNNCRPYDASGEDNDDDQ